MRDPSKAKAEYVSFHVARQVLGIPVAEVREILPQRVNTRVPSAPKAVSGILNLRGQIVTTIDLRERMALPRRPPDDGYMSVVVHHEGELFNLQVDSVGDVLNVSGEDFAEPPPTLDPVWRGCSRGVFRLEAGLLIVLNVASLLDLSTHRSLKGVS